MLIQDDLRVWRYDMRRTHKFELVKLHVLLICWSENKFVVMYLILNGVLYYFYAKCKQCSSASSPEIYILIPLFVYKMLAASLLMQNLMNSIFIPAQLHNCKCLWALVAQEMLTIINTGDRKSVV